MADVDPVIQEVEKVCTKLVENLGAKFFLKERPITLSEVFSDKGLLPALCKRADQLSSLCFGYGMDVTFEDEERSMLGTKVIFQLTGRPELLRGVRILCLADVILDIFYKAPSPHKISLDELLYD